MTPLKFYLGEESHYIVEDYAGKNESIFADQYNKALRLIEAYVDAKDDKIDGQESRNNIIAFMGDRGTGKTSCMMSVLNMLNQHLVDRNDPKRIASVDVVDPSFFDENTNIIYLVVGKMFAVFKDNFEKCGNDINKEKVHKLMTAFQNVLSQISMMGKSPLNDNDTDIHQLENLLVTVNLKKSIQTLVDCYLSYFERDYLVVPVDDIDNNTNQAYQMMEQIRKYLILPKVIILISFKLEQIYSVAELYFMKLYESLLSKQQILTVNVSDMAHKYLLKLFPLEHRIALPELKTMMDKDVDVYRSRDDKVLEVSGSSMRYTMTKLIFRKTRYLFYHSTGETSPIVPMNLREYRNLLSLLCNMDDYLSNKNEYNKHQFRNYFFGEWVEKHLNKEAREIAYKLTKNTEAGQFNKLVLRLLSEYKPIKDFGVQEFQELLSEEDENEMPRSRSRRYFLSGNARNQYEFERILDDGNLSYNVSMGDVFAVINEWKKYLVAEEDKALLFFVESLYSIKLYHYYDEITESRESEVSENAKIDSTIKRLDELDGVSNYEKLVGGAFYNPNLLRFLPVERDSRKSRSYRVVSIQPIKNLLSQSDSEVTAMSDLEFQLIEFFALTLSRCLEDKIKDSLSLFYRLIPEVYYRSDLSGKQKAIFELGSFFVSITNIRYAYTRIHAKLYEFALERDNSLLKRLIRLTNDRYSLGPTYDNNRFLSWCSIRNAVILQELGDSFSYVKTRRTDSSDQIDLLRDFFVQVSSFKIKTYDKLEDDTSPIEIKFDYAKVFVDLFSRIKDDEAALQLFQQVFDDSSNDSVDTKPDFNVRKIALGLQKEVKKSTLSRRIEERSSITPNHKEFWSAFDAKVTEYKIPKDRAIAVLIELKDMLNL